jgi:hypothetical protein
MQRKIIARDSKGVDGYLLGVWLSLTQAMKHFVLEQGSGNECLHRRFSDATVFAVTGAKQIRNFLQLLPYARYISHYRTVFVRA